MSSIATRLDHELRLRGLTAQQLSRLSGVSQVTLSRLRAGRRVRNSTLTRIGRALAGAPPAPGVEGLLLGSGPEDSR